MKVLYVGALTPNDTALHRLWALERLGATVVPFSSRGYESSNVILRKVFFRLSAGPAVERLNVDLLQVAAAERPDVFWADKMLWIKPETLLKLRAMGIVTVSYMIDNPFGTRQDPGWRLYRKDIQFYDLHVVQRETNIRDYKSRGARDVIKIQTAYEPTLHFPPQQEWSDKDRDREVSFIGTPYDDRAKTLTRLWREAGFSVSVSGGSRVWKRALGAEAFAAVYKGKDEFYGEAYREAIWRSKINLSFLTRSNQDEFAHKSFEIAGCGGFLLAERSDGHSQRFVEDKEAVFFSGYEELVEKIKRYLPDEAGRRRIAAAGRTRAEKDGYYNDRQVGLVLERAMELLPGVRAAAIS